MTNDEFNDRAKEVVSVAQEEAILLQHEKIKAYHLLLGLLREPDEDLAGMFLIEKGLTSQSLKEIIKSLNNSTGEVGNSSLPFDADAHAVIEQAIKEALQLGNQVISTEHLLLGILLIASDELDDIFEKFELERPELYEELINAIDQPGTLAAAGAPAARERGHRGGSLLDKFGKNLTEQARREKIDPVIGREKEIQRVIQILARRNKNNPILLGEPGTGKTSIIEGLAQLIADGQVSSRLENKEVYALDLALIVAGTKYRGEFEERLKKIIDEVKERDDIILFIDEIHNLVGMGASEGAMDAANILKPALARGEFQAIGATTYSEYKKYFEKDSALERRFQRVDVDPPSVEETILILEGLQEKYEDFHKVRFEKKALTQAVLLSDRYINGRFLPDKAIDLMDEAASFIFLSNGNDNDLKKINATLEDLKDAKDVAIEKEEFQTAKDLNIKIAELKQEKNKLTKNQNNNKKESWPVVTSEDIARVIMMSTGINLSKLTQAENEKIKQMEEIVSSRIIGQEEAVHTVSKAIRLSKVGLQDENQPLGSFLFLGPSGVGKTELAKTLAGFLFNDDKQLIRLDMSEYSEKHNVSRLVGSPPGYVGHGEGGQLTEAVRRKPYSIVLFDEIEKAHPDVWNMLLQILEEGELTDGEGRKASFKNTVIIMTSNIGAEALTSNKASIGFSGDSSADAAFEQLKEKVLTTYKKVFKPELQNRIQEVVVFNKLTEADLQKIIEINLLRPTTILKSKGLTLKITDEAKKLIIKEGYNPAMGARPLAKAIRRLVEEPLAEELLNVLLEGTVVEVAISPDDEKKTIIKVNIPTSTAPAS